MERKALTTALLSTVVSSLLWIGCVSEVLAQEVCKRKVDNSGATSKITEQHVLDVRDRPRHQVRIFEMHRQYASDTPNCEGRTRKESRIHGYSDYTGGNGRAWGYGVTTFDNGDKIFNEWTGTSHRIVMEDGKKKRFFAGVNNYTGGTGIYRGVRGFSRSRVFIDPATGSSVFETEEEYEIEK